MHRLLFTLGVVLLVLMPSIARAQRAPDPVEKAREAAEPYLRGFAVEPYHNGNMIGPMHSPKGKLARVVWLQGGSFGSELPGDPPGWERRVVQLFDDEGRCIEIEDWSMGQLESSRSLLYGEYGSVEAIHSTRGGFKEAAWLSEFRRDGAGRLIAIVRLPLDPSGKLDPKSPALPERDIGYDDEGRRTSQVDYRERQAEHWKEWTYDSEGRVETERNTTCALGLTVTTSYAYDEQDRVRTATVHSSNGYPGSRTEYEYDGLSARVRRNRTIQAGEIEGQMTCEYDAEGHLTKRSTENRRYGQYNVETFDGGEGRLVARERFQDGRVIEIASFEYVEDGRGNWVQKIAVRNGVRENDTMRVIEYAD